MLFSPHFLRATDRPEAVVQVPGVQQRPCLLGLVQGGPHDLVPQGGVEADDLLDVAEQLGGLHLGEQAALLQVQQPAQEQLQGGRTSGGGGRFVRLRHKRLSGSLTRRAPLRAPANASSGAGASFTQPAARVSQLHLHL